MDDRPVWRIKTANSLGWVETIHDDRPLITGTEAQAMTWPDEATAQRMATVLNQACSVHLIAVPGVMPATGPDPGWDPFRH